ncbi:MAG: redoxin domain-containing protein [Chitinophagaceae bacterium]|nr:redoxin domain-containing protein [Chitinophagaceae bacterium]
MIFIFTLMVFVMVVSAQDIPKWKIEDVVRSYSAKNDTVYVVNFWATFCKPCIEEIPHFLRLAEKYKSQKVKLLLVSLDLPAYYPAKIVSFAKKNNYNTNIVWLNETNADHFCPMIDQKWSGAIPSTIIVNNSNGYRKFKEEEMSAVELERSLQEAIGGNARYQFTAPMNDAEVLDKNEGGAAFMKIDYVSFKSKDSAVYAVTGGTVNAIARIEEFKLVIIEKDGLFLYVFKLTDYHFKKGDHIKQDQLIGYAGRNLDGAGPVMEFYLNDREKSIALSRANFITRKDKRLTDHSIELMDNEPQ